MTSVSSYGDPVMAVPVSLQLQYIQTSGDISPEYKAKASYFIAATEADHNSYPCNVNSPLTPKSEYSNGPYTINVIDSGSDQVISLPTERLYETDYGHYCGFTYEQTLSVASELT